MVNIRTEQVIAVQDWDKLVQETYGRRYSFQQQDGCKERQRVRICVPDEDYMDFENDTVPEIVNGDDMGVSFAAWLARDPNQPTTEDEIRYVRKYEAAIPSCCELQTFEEHANQLMICWGVAYAVEYSSSKTPCGECEYNTEMDV